MNYYLVTLLAGTPVTLQAVGFAAHGAILTFYKYDGHHDPASGVYANTINTHLFKMDDVHRVEMVDEPVAI